MIPRTPSSASADAVDLPPRDPADVGSTLTANTVGSPPGAPLDDLVGRTLGDFVLRDKIGQGGFGAVYRAMQSGLEREAVVKVPHPWLRTARAATDRFLREARLASKLDHPYA